MLTPAQTAFWLVAVVITVACLWLGERPQKISAAAVIAAFLASVPAEPLLWHGVRAGVALVDLALAAFLFIQSVSGRRWWLHAASAFAWGNALIHLAALVDADIWWLAYVASRWMFSALVLAAPFVGFIEKPYARRYREWEQGISADARTILPPGR